MSDEQDKRADEAEVEDEDFEGIRSAPAASPATTGAAASPRITGAAASPRITGAAASPRIRGRRLRFTFGPAFPRGA